MKGEAGDRNLQLQACRRLLLSAFVYKTIFLSLSLSLSFNKNKSIKIHLYTLDLGYTTSLLKPLRNSVAVQGGAKVLAVVQLDKVHFSVVEDDCSLH